jgi:D-inositol-3-phosphate glycosyltransferase
MEPVGAGRAGGMNVFTSSLYSSLGRFCEIDIFSHGGNGCVKIAPNVNLIHIDTKDIENFAGEIIGYHAKRRYDLIHTHYWLSGIVGLFLQKSIKRPWVHTFHTIEIFKCLEKDPLRIEVEEEIMRCSDLIISPTQREASAIRALYPDTQVITIPHGVDTNKFRAHVDGSSNLLYVGRIDPIKGLEFLIDAMRILNNESKLDIIGGPSKKQGSLESIKSYAKGLKVNFLGRINHDELCHHYRTAAMVIIPSYYESFGLIALEAMASARPVIGFKDTGLSETVRDETGILVDRNEHHLARAVDLLLKNKNLRYRLGLRGRKNVLNYRWEDIAHDYFIAYESISKN